PKQFAMSGNVNGELPLWISNPHWIIENGWIANSGPLTFRMDKDMADAITRNNVAAGAAMDWLRYMEISRSWATLNLDNLGELTMEAQVKGTSRFSNRNQTVNLNYRHQENLFQLWRSLRFGDNLQSWVEQNATLPSKKDQSP
ncbi:intermembrane phospholipid transport protein YdbH family protein, partial [Pantoea ananatis]